MRRAPRRGAGFAALIAAALALSACNSATTSVRVTGQPSISIEVPLGLAACTGSNSCVALGTSALASTPPVTAQYRRASGHWDSLATPNATGVSLTSSSCWSTGCLIGGATSTGDLVWRYSAPAHSISAVAPPALGQSVVAVSCFRPGTCDLIDTTGVAGPTRLVDTTDAGVTWSTPEDLSVASGYAVTELACANTLDCDAVESPLADAPAGSVAALEATIDGGITWQDAPLPAGAVTLSSLTCSTKGCDVLATTSHGVAWAHSRGPGRAWTAHGLAATGTALACTRTGRCVIVGAMARGPWVAVAHEHSVTSASLTYVPSAFSAAACGATLCALVGASTVATLSP